MKKATWIKPKTSLLLTFKEKEPPRCIEIPGEKAKTKVYVFYERPMRCETCLRYGHTVKRWHEPIEACAKCSCHGHNKNMCTSTEDRRCHCGDYHQSFSRNCPVFKRETEIDLIQRKERIPRLQAIRKLLRINPHPDLIVSNAVKNTSNRTTSKYPTRSNQESHPNLVKTTHCLFRPTATDTILREKVERKGARLPTANCRRQKSEKTKKIKY